MQNKNQLKLKNFLINVYSVFKLRTPPHKGQALWYLYIRPWEYNFNLLLKEDNLSIIVKLCSWFQSVCYLEVSLYLFIQSTKSCVQSANKSRS